MRACIAIPESPQYISSMIVGLGMDLVEVPRLRAFQARWGQRGLERLFSTGELAYCLDQPDPGPSLAARFAAKEAFFKAVGMGWGRGGDWREVQVRRGVLGAPELQWGGRAARAVEAVGAATCHITMTHSRSTAAAVVVLES